MGLLTQHVIKVHFKGISLNLPHPVAYGLHKIIISTKRKKKDKKIKDVEAAKTVLSALSKDDRQLLKEIFETLTKNEKRAIRDVIESDLLLRDFFQ